MTIPILTNEPQRLVAGDTWKWERSWSDYPAGTWTVTYYFHLLSSSSVKFSIAASQKGSTDVHSVSVAKGTTAAYTAGNYDWHAYADSGTERKRVDTGTLEVLKDFTSSSAIDNRSFWRKQLDAIEAVLDNRASQAEASYSINGRALSRTPFAELREHHAYAKAKVNQEERADNAANGMGHRGRILAGF
jgi:hypothetical protein|tara:strand:- start:589 stop:1155 length:567 start_codon:yes stop_codon:yes gene_type:complete